MLANAFFFIAWRQDIYYVLKNSCVSVPRSFLIVEFKKLQKLQNIQRHWIFGIEKIGPQEEHRSLIKSKNQKPSPWPCLSLSLSIIIIVQNKRKGFFLIIYWPDLLITKFQKKKMTSITTKLLFLCWNWLENLLFFVSGIPMGTTVLRVYKTFLLGNNRDVFQIINWVYSYEMINSSMWIS